MNSNYIVFDMNSNYLWEWGRSPEYNRNKKYWLIKNFVSGSLGKLPTHFGAHAQA